MTITTEGMQRVHTLITQRVNGLVADVEMLKIHPTFVTKGQIATEYAKVLGMYEAYTVLLHSVGQNKVPDDLSVTMSRARIAISSIGMGK